MGKAIEIINMEMKQNITDNISIFIYFVRQQVIRKISSQMVKLNSCLFIVVTFIYLFEKQRITFACHTILNVVIRILKNSFIALYATYCPTPARYNIPTAVLQIKKKAMLSS